MVKWLALLTLRSLEEEGKADTLEPEEFLVVCMTTAKTIVEKMPQPIPPATENEPDHLAQMIAATPEQIIFNRVAGFDNTASNSYRFFNQALKFRRVSENESMPLLLAEQLNNRRYIGAN